METNSEILNSRVKNSVSALRSNESEQFNYESVSDDSSLDLNSIVLKLADVENFNVDSKCNSTVDDKFKTITLRCNKEYNRDGNEIGTESVDDNSNENIKSMYGNKQSEWPNDFTKQEKQEDERHNTAVCTYSKIIRVNKMVAAALDNAVDTPSQTYSKKLVNFDDLERREYSTNDCNMINIINRNIKRNVASVGVSTNNGNTNEFSSNIDSERNAAENSSPSDDSSASASVTDSSVNSLLNRLQYGIKDDTESSETDCSTTSSDEEMTSLDSGIRTVIYESAGSTEQLKPELNRVDNVKVTTKSSCVLS